MATQREYDIIKNASDKRKGIDDIGEPAYKNERPMKRIPQIHNVFTNIPGRMAPPAVPVAPVQEGGAESIPSYRPTEEARIDMTKGVPERPYDNDAARKALMERTKQQEQDMRDLFRYDVEMRALKDWIPQREQAIVNELKLRQADKYWSYNNEEYYKELRELSNQKKKVIDWEKEEEYLKEMRAFQEAEEKRRRAEDEAAAKKAHELAKERIKAGAKGELKPSQQINQLKLDAWNRVYLNPEKVGEADKKMLGLDKDPYILRSASFVAADLTSMRLSTEQKVAKTMEIANLLRGEQPQGKSVKDRKYKQYKTPEEVRQAFKQKRINRSLAEKILQTDYGYE